MASNFIKFIKETLDNIDGLDPQKMRELARETAYYLQKLEDMLKTGIPEDQAKAIESALEIKELLETQSNHLAENAEMTAQEFREMIQNGPSLFTSEKDKETIADISNYLEHNKNKKHKTKLKPIHLS